MRIPCGAAFCVAALASCTGPVAITYPPAPPPAPPPPAVSAPEPPAPPPAPWALVYQRGCHDSITPPVLSLDGASVASCGALFSADRGRYLGRAPANLRAFLPEGRALVDPHQSNGVGVVEPGRSEPREGSGGLLQGLAVSADGARVVSLETAGLTGDRALVVRELPSLRELRKTPLGPGPSLDPALGFLPDGREIVLGAVGCTIEDCTDPAEKKRNPQASCARPRCPEPTVLVVEGGRASPLSPALSGITAAAFAGERALVVRAGGAVALVELPSGREVATLPWPKDTAPTALALSPSGDRAAVAADGRLTLFARAGASFQPVYTGDRGFTRTLAFAPDGRTLFTGDSLTAYREGAAARPAEEPALPITPAPGFTKLRREHGSFVYDGGERSIPTGGVAAYRDEKLGAEHLSDPSRAVTLRGLTNARNALRALGSEDARFVLVVHGQALAWLRRDEPENLTREAAELIATGKVELRVCAKTLEEHRWQLGDMVPGAQAVPSGTLEVLRLEGAGYRYFRP